MGRICVRGFCRGPRSWTGSCRIVPGTQLFCLLKLFFCVTDNMKGMAVAAFFDMVVAGKFIPVALLLRAQNTSAAAERTAVVESGEDGVADKG